VEEEKAIEEVAPAVAGDDLPDWMAGLQGDAVADEPSAEEPAPAMASGASSDEDLPDWLSGGDGASDRLSAVEEEKAIEEAAPAVAGDDLPDWMVDLQPATESSTEDLAFSTDEEDEVSVSDDKSAPIDWLAGLDDDGDEEDEEAADWLVDLQGGLSPEEEVAPGISAADEPITAGDAPRPSEEEEPPIETGELPGWISDLQDDAATQDSESLPDLIKQEEIPQEFVADMGDPESGELPDWLSTLSKESDSTSPPETPTKI